MKNLVTAIEQSDCNVSIEISSGTLDSFKLDAIKESISDVSTTFSVASEFSRNPATRAGVSSTHTALQTPRLNAQAPTPIKGSFAVEGMGRSSSHDKIILKPKFPLASSSSREVPLFKSKIQHPVLEVSLHPDLLSPNVDNNQFNNFLESELERIKKLFLEDSPDPKSSRDRGHLKEKLSLDMKDSKLKASTTETQTSNTDLRSAFAAQSSRKVIGKSGSTRTFGKQK